MKHRILLLVALLAGLMVPQITRAYDFEAACSTGQTLYYNILGNTVSVTYKGNSTSNPNPYTNMSGNLTIPNKVTYNHVTYSVTAIGDYAFATCSSLAQVTVPNSITTIGKNAFAGCSSLTSITIPTSVTNIGEGAFFECSRLTSLPITQSITSIGQLVFYGCNSLTTVSIPSHITSIGAAAFANCYGLTSISVEGGNPTYDSRNNCNAIIETATNTLISGCINTNIPNTVTSIGDNAFFQCGRLTAINIPTSVTSIGANAFYECYRLTSVTIPNHVTFIGYRAFYNCTGLTYLKVLSNTPPVLNNDVFYGRNSNMVIEIPCGSLTNYQSAWGSSYNFSEISSNNYSITLQVNNSEWGSATIQQQDGHDIACNGTAILSATANSHCHFVQWSDGSTENPHTVTVTQNTTYTAKFAIDQYTITATANNATMGSVSGSGSYNYGNTATLTATPNTGYQFTKWNDGNTSNPRQVTVRTNATYTAQFTCQPSTGDTTATACENFTWWNTDFTDNTDGATHTFVQGAANGCDSVVTLHLTINHSTTGDTSASGCESFDWYEHPNLTQSIDNLTHTFAQRAANGCDSVVTLHLTINSSTAGDTTATACEHFKWWNTDFTDNTDGATHTFVQGAANGCDSVVTLHLTISHSTAGVWNAYACDYYDWYEHTNLAESSDNLTHTFVQGAANGCDSVVTLHLIINQSTTGDTTAEAYDHFDWYEHTGMTTSQDVTHTFTNANQYGCDSIVTLHLTILTNTDTDSLIYSDATKTVVIGYVEGLTHAVIPNTVTRIADSAFYNCTTLTSVDIPNSVTSIGRAAFYACINLTRVTIPNSVTSIEWQVFSFCKNLTNITVENGNSIYDSRDNCNAIIKTATNTMIAGCKTTFIPNTVSSIGIYAFNGCSGLSNITIPNSVTIIDAGAFAQTGLTSIIIPNSVTKIESYAFRSCTNLTGLIIPNSVTSIGYDAFGLCYGLTSITIGSSVTSIGGWAFRSCRITTIIIPQSVTSIGIGPFDGCQRLTSIIVEEENSKYDSRNNCNAIIETATNTLWQGCKNTVIPTSVTEIGEEAFYGCTGLTNIIIPTSVTKFGKESFYNCPMLTDITIPNMLTEIDDMAFMYCRNLTNIKILTSIPPSLSTTDVFAFTPSNMVIEIPCGSLAAYQQAWGTGYNYTEYYPEFTVTLQVNEPAWGTAAITQQDGRNIACDSTAILTATPNEGYEFLQWQDGNTDNPRTVQLTRDTSFTATFESTTLDSLIYSDATKTVVIGYVEGLTNAVIPNRVTRIDDFAFEDCGTLANVQIPNSVTSIGYAAFVGCTNLTNVTIPGSVTSIEEWAFSDCSGLTNVNLPNSVTRIEPSTFAYCTGLTGVAIPNTVTHIGNSAFTSCQNLTHVTIPESVTGIGKGAFYRCNSLDTVEMLSANPPSVYPSSFLSTPIDMVVTIPCGSRTAYETAWGTGYNFATARSSSGEEVLTACDSYTWPLNGTTYTENPTVAPMTTLIDAEGCDSIVTLLLTVNHSQSSHEYVTHCGAYTWEADGRIYSQSGDLYHTGTTTEGCLSRDTLTLTIIDKRSNHEHVTNCGPYTWAVNGKTYNKSGVKTYKSTAEDGCPVYDTLTLSVAHGRTSHEYLTHCGPYTWDANGRTYTTSGNKYYTGSTPEGCPIRDTLTLMIVDKWVSHEYVINCGPYTWDANGMTYNKSGVKYFKSMAEDGCPVYDTLTLTIAHGRTSHEYVTHCGPYSWEVTGQTYNQSGNMYFTSITEMGCPIRDTLTLTVVDRWSRHEYVTHCGPYTWDATGRTYNQSGVKTYKRAAEDGCMVYDTLTLTVASGRTSHEYLTHCGPYTWEVTGKTYNKSGDKFYKGLTPEGCPIRDTISLTVVDKWSHHEYVTNCGPYTWSTNGKTYNKSGEKTHKSTSEDGCPVYDTLTLTVAHGRSSHAYVTHCGPYTWEVTGKTYNQSGDKFYKSTTPEGCPIRDTLTLVVNPIDSSETNVMANDRYTWYGTIFISSATAMRTLTNQYGCDSVVTLHLTVITSGGTAEHEEELAENDAPEVQSEAMENIGIEQPEAAPQTETLNPQVSILNSLTVYPNPTTGHLQLNVTQVDKIDVIDLVGRCVAVFEKTNRLDLSGLANGTYTLRITTPDGVALRKVVKR